MAATDDRDLDRIADVCDVCPDEPETYQGIADEDGCPDVPRDDFGHPLYTYGTPIATIGFASGSADRTAESASAVASAVAFVTGAEVDRFVCLGRAATDEPDAEVLAARRASALCAAMRSMGVGTAVAVEASLGGDVELPWNTPGHDPREALVLVLAARGEELWRLDAGGATWIGPPEAPPQVSAPPPVGCDVRR